MSMTPPKRGGIGGVVLLFCAAAHTSPAPAAAAISHSLAHAPENGGMPIMLAEPTAKPANVQGITRPRPA